MIGDIIDRLWDAMWKGITAAAVSAGAMAGITLFFQVWKLTKPLRM